MEEVRRESTSECAVRVLESTGESAECTPMDICEERNVSMVRTFREFRIGAVNTRVTEGRCELDNHADTCVVGPGTALVIHEFPERARVFGYDESVAQATDCRIVSAVVAYDCPQSGDVFMVTIHQAILIPSLKTNLLCSMQMRDNDVRVNDEPKFMVPNPTDEHHAITVPCYQDTDGLTIPLSLHGVTHYFPCRKPTKSEYEHSDLSKRIELTAESPTWDPKTDRFDQQESNCVPPEEIIRTKLNREATVMAIETRSAYVSALQSFPDEYDYLENELGMALSGNAKTIDVRIKAVHSGKRRDGVSAQDLAKNWCITLEAAQRTLDATTQRGVRTRLHELLSRRFTTNERPTTTISENTA